MKTLTMLGVIAIVFTGCGTLISPETQYERESLIEAYDAARQKHNPERVKKAVKDLLVGKWQYVGLEVEEGSVTAKASRVDIAADPPNSSSSATDGLPKAARGEASTTSNAPKQTAVPNLPNPEATPQPPEAEATATRLPPIEVTDEKSQQRILDAKAALVASTRKNLILEFSEDRTSYYYSG